MPPSYFDIPYFPLPRDEPVISRPKLISTPMRKLHDNKLFEDLINTPAVRQLPSIVRLQTHPNVLNDGTYSLD